jgi:putative ATP-binding cassette transporter
MFINGPIAEVIAAAPFLAKANFAIQKINTLEAELRAIADDRPEASAVRDRFHALRCDGLTFRYPRVEGQREFVVGPLDLEIRRGEITFLVGGNGTGKSTFLKLLCGLLPADGGTLTLNDHVITPSRLAYYRSYFAIILQDFRLFRRLLGLPAIDHGRVDDLLSMLRLTGITAVDKDGRFISTKLSTGQRKRLALLVVEMDDREIYVFDEWAADQDPEFRKYFYESYLKQLRDRGKTVIAATHDDHYFHIADRVIKLDNGRITSVLASRSSGGAGIPL